MNYNFKNLTHPGIKILKPYVPGKSLSEIEKTYKHQEIIKLASNENVLGCSPRVLDALHRITKEDTSIYPTSISHPLRTQLAEHLGVNPQNITLSNGSDLIICLLLTCFAANSDKHILTHDYAFMSYAIQATTLGIPVISTATQNWQVDIDEIISKCNSKTAIIFLANPNNPTGLLIKHQEIIRLIENIPQSTILVVDEAYYEYAKEDYMGNSLELIDKHPNLVIMRTFSKAYGLAGLRIGYAISCKEISEIMYSVQLPFAVNIGAMLAASVALKDQVFIENTLKMNNEGLLQMQEGLNSLKISYIPSKANFITIDCQENANNIANELEKYAIFTRPLGPYNMGNYLRITIGTYQQNLKVLQSLKEIRNK